MLVAGIGVTGVPVQLPAPLPQVPAAKASLVTHDFTFDDYSDGDPIKGYAAQGDANNLPTWSWGDLATNWVAHSTVSTYKGAFPNDTTTTGNRRHYAYAEQSENSAGQAGYGFAMSHLIIVNNDPLNSVSFTFWCGSQSFTDTLDAKGDPGHNDARTYEESAGDFAALGITSTCNTTAHPLGEISL